MLLAQVLTSSKWTFMVLFLDLFLHTDPRVLKCFELSWSKRSFDSLRTFSLLPTALNSYMIPICSHTRYSFPFKSARDSEGLDRQTWYYWGRQYGAISPTPPSCFSKPWWPEAPATGLSLPCQFIDHKIFLSLYLMFLYQEISFNNKDYFFVSGIQEVSSKVLVKGTLVFLKLYCSSLWPNLSPDRLSSIFPKPTIMDSPSTRTSCVSWLPSYSFSPSAPKRKFNFTVTGEEQRHPLSCLFRTSTVCHLLQPATPTATPGDYLIVVPWTSVIWISLRVEHQVWAHIISAWLLLSPLPRESPIWCSKKDSDLFSDTKKLSSTTGILYECLYISKLVW